MLQYQNRLFKKSALFFHGCDLHDQGFGWLATHWENRETRAHKQTREHKKWFYRPKGEKIQDLACEKDRDREKL